MITWLSRATIGALLTIPALSMTVHAKTPTEKLKPIAIVLTNDTRGIVEPCGCNNTEGTMGGLAQRAALLKEFRQHYHAVLPLDSGNLAGDATRSQLILDAMGTMGYRAVGIGNLDRTVGALFLKAASRFGITVIDTTHSDVEPPTGVERSMICDVGRYRIGIAGISAACRMTTDRALCTRIDPVLRDLRARADFVIVLSQLGLRRDKIIAQQPIFQDCVDLLFGNEDAQELSTPMTFGRVHLAPTNAMGKQVSVIELNRANGSTQFSMKRIAVDAHYGRDPRIQDKVDAFQRAQAEMLQRIQPNRERKTTRVGVDKEFHPDYLSAEECGKCHIRAYNSWRKHPHSKAYETLHLRNRLIKECVVCHSERFRRTGSLISSEDTVDGVQCTTCHGTGVMHRLLSGKGAIVRRVPENVCRACHDKAHSPRFNYVNARQHIKHW